MNISGSKTMEPSSASQTTRRRSWATWFSSSFLLLGKHLSQGAEAAVVESVKAASGVNAPASGEVLDVNHALEETPALVNEDPAGKGWFLKLKLSDPAELAALMDEEAYQAYVKTLA